MIGIGKSGRVWRALFASLGCADACFAAAIVWAAVTVATKYQIGYMAIGVGALVGLSARYFGRSSSTAVRVLAAAFSLAGCLLGNYLAQVGFYVVQNGVDLLEFLRSLDLSAAPGILLETAEPMDVLFYGIAVFEAWKLAADPDGAAGAAGVGLAEGAEPGSAAPFIVLFDYPRGRAALAAGLFALLGVAPAVFLYGVEYRSVQRYPSGAVQAEGNKRAGSEVGAWAFYGEDGALVARADFRGGRLDGKVVRYAEGGRVAAEETWVRGLQHGPSVEYGEDGKIAAEGAYAHGRMDGPWTRYHASGAVARRENYLLDRLHGKAESFAEDGALLAAENYDLGEPEGEWTSWTAGGGLLSRRSFEGGEERIQDYAAGGAVLVRGGEGFFEARAEDGTLTRGRVEGGRKAGLWEDRAPDGSLRRSYRFGEGGTEILVDYFGEDGAAMVKGGEGELVLRSGDSVLYRASYRAGLLDGTAESYYPDGALMSSTSWAAGAEAGPQKTFYADGQVMVEGTSEGGKRTGTWTWFESDGSVSSTVAYEAGKKQGLQTFFANGRKTKEEEYREGAYVGTKVLP